MGWHRVGWASVDRVSRWSRGEAAGRGKTHREHGMQCPNGNPVDAPNPLLERIVGMAFLHD
jgi:hypothetical protein